MIQRALAGFPLTSLTCVGLLLFMTVFVGALAWVLRRGSESIYSKMKQLPLQDLESLPKGGH